MALRGVLSLAVAVLTSCAGPQRPWSGKGYCEISGEQASAPGHEKWVRLLLRGYDPATRRVTAPALDCTSAQVRWAAPAVACSDGSLATTELPARPIAEADVIVSPLGEGFGIVWIVTNRFASGDALGPVAVVEQRRDEFVVRAIGALRAYPDHAALRLERIGTLPVLVAEGQLCPGADPASCIRSARVMPLRGDRFSQEPLLSEQGACVSPAWFDLVRQESDRLDTGWRRRHQLAASLVFGAEGLRVEEQLLVHDLDPKQPQAQPRLHRKAQGERTIRAEGKRLVTDRRSLWTEGGTGGR
jgi:hypothetical protein